MEQLTITIGDTDIDVDFRGFSRWFLFKNGKRMKGLERWIMRSAKRHDDFNEKCDDALREAA